MRRRAIVAAFAASGVVIGTAATAATSAPAAASDAGSTLLTNVAGAAPVLLSGAVDNGAAPQQQEHVVLSLKLRNTDQLQSLLAGRHAALTPAQFTAAYGPSAATVDAVTSWARSAGLAVTEVSPNNTLVGLSGSTAAMDAALGTRTDLFTASGRTYRSVNSTVSLPSGLADQVAGINGLSDLGVLHTPLHTAAAATPGPTTFGPKDLATFYDAPSTATGSGAQVAVIAEGQLSGVVQDLRTFETKFGLPQVPVTIVGNGSSDTSGSDEFDLDTQYSTGEAPDVSGLTIYDGASLSNADILSTINTWVTDDSVKQASFSAGECELLAGVTGFTTSLDQTLQQAAAQGQSLFVSSGDNGSFCSAVVGVNGIPAGVPSVEYPASSPYAVGVGGTTVLNLGSTGLYANEITWYGGGGGLSYFEAKPAYQTAAPLPGRRGVPDVALDADPTSGYTVIVNGTAETIGGTSASAPAWQGYWARAQGVKGGGLGFANYKLYNAPATAFHDIVVGTNGLFTALPGYDYTTGRGTPDVAKLIASF